MVRSLHRASFGLSLTASSVTRRAQPGATSSFRSFATLRRPTTHSAHPSNLRHLAKSPILQSRRSLTTNSRPRWTIAALQAEFGTFALWWWAALFFVWTALYADVPISGRVRIVLPAPLWRSMEEGLFSLCTKAHGEELSEYDSRVQRLQAVVGRVVYAAGLEREQWIVKVLEGDECTCANIRASHTLVATTGLLKAAESESALAFAVGREVSRVLGRHDCDEAYLACLPQGVALITVPLLLNVLREARTVTPPVRPKGLTSVIMFMAFHAAADPICKFVSQGTRDQEADHMSLVLRTSAGYNLAERDVFQPAMMSRSWQLAFAGTNPIFKLSSWLFLKNDAQRINELKQLTPSVREMVKSHNGPWPPKHVPPKSWSEFLRKMEWPAFVIKREERRAA